MVFGCVHHVGLYALLRVAVGSRSLAAGGTLAVLATSFFSPLLADQGELATIWQWPSLSVLRSPLDVWLFMALLLHARKPTLGRAVAAGTIAGLALWFETDTGIFVVGTLLVYGVCRAVATECGGSLPRAEGSPGVAVAATTAAALLVLAIGLGVASQGTILTRPGEFFSGWIGGVANSSARGVGAVHFALFLRDHAAWLPVALAILGAALFAVCDTMVRLLSGRATPNTVVSGCLGLFALGRLTLFVWRTVPIRLSLAAIPVGVLLVLVLSRWMAQLRDRRFAPAIPAALLATAALLLLASPTFRHYPNVWFFARGAAPTDGIALFPERREVAGLPPNLRPVVRSIRGVVEEVRSLDEPVAVLDPIKTLVYVEAGKPPWRGDASLFLNTWTRADQRALVEDLDRRGPPHVIFRSVPSSPAVADTWAVLQEAIEARYVPARKLGIFVRWDRKPGL
jgi:hypothetical protein